MVYREEIALYFDNHAEHTNTLCGQNIECIYNPQALLS